MSTAQDWPSTSRPRLWTAVLAVLLVVVLQAVLSAPILFLAAAGNVAALKDPAAVRAMLGNPTVLVAMLAASGVTMALVLGSAAALSPCPLGQRFSLRRARASPADVLKLLLAGFALGAITTQVAKALDQYDASTPQRIRDAVSGASPTVVLALASLGAFVGLGEELVFRGYLQTRLTERLGTWVGVGLTALVFGLVHFDPVQGSFAALYGLLLGAVAVQRRSIVVGIVAHMLNNAVAFSAPKLLSGAEASGLEFSTLEMLVATAVFCGCVWSLHRRRVATGDAAPAAGPVDGSRAVAPRRPGRLLAVLGVWLLSALISAAVLVGAVVVTVQRTQGDRALSTLAREQGRAFALDHDDRACVDQALSQAAATRDTVSRTAASAFLSSCLRHAPASAGFCDGVPDVYNFAGVAAWLESECAALGGPERGTCAPILAAVPVHCRANGHPP